MSKISRAVEMEVVRRARAGESFTDIAADLGMSRVHAGRIAHRHGVTKRTSGRNHWKWSGGRRAAGEYVQVLAPDHPRASRGYVMEHVLVAEEALGRHLPDGVVVHHVNRVRDDNRPSNLVICQDQGYHLLLHQRQRAIEACGNPDWIPCEVCGEHDDPAAMYVRPNRNAGRHRECHAQAEARRAS